MELIVNGDDFGVTLGVNRAIVAAHSHGVLTSTTVLVTSPYAAQAPDTARRWPELGFGLHVNLTDGPAAARPETIPSMVDGDGHFLPERALLRGLVTRAIRPDDIAREVSAQLAAFRALGLEPTHWDAHRHLAFWPRLCTIIGPVLAQEGMRRSRTPRMWFMRPAGQRAPFSWRRSTKRTVAQTAARAIRPVLMRHFAQPDYMTGAGMVLAKADLAGQWRYLFENLHLSGVCEVVIHPGEVDDELRAASPGMFDQRAIDLAAATAPGLEERLTRRGVRLRNFRGLGA